MKPKHMFLSSLCGAVLLGGCSFETAQDGHWLVKPTMTASSQQDNPQIWYDLGRYYQGQERHEEASLAFNKALAANGNFTEARNRLGVSLASLGRYNEAIASFELAARAAPAAAHIQSNLGYAYYLKGDFEAAVASLQRAVALDPANRRALNNLGLAYSQLGNAGRAREAFGGAATGDSPVGASQTGRSPPQDPPQVLAQTDSRVQAIQVEPNVYELRIQQAAPPVAAAAAAGSAEAALPLRVEVSNGNGVTGMARRVGAYLRGSGFPATRFTNQAIFTVAASRVEYRAGLEADARRIAAAMPQFVAVVPGDGLRKDIGVRLVLGRDLAGSLAYFGPRSEAVNLAHSQPRGH